MALLASARSTETMGSFTHAPTLSELQQWTRARELPEGYDAEFLDLEDPHARDEEPPRADPGAPDDDTRDDSGFEAASSIADSLSN